MNLPCLPLQILEIPWSFLCLFLFCRSELIRLYNLLADGCVSDMFLINLFAFVGENIFLKWRFNLWKILICMGREDARASKWGKASSAKIQTP